MPPVPHAQQAVPARPALEVLFALLIALALGTTGASPALGAATEIEVWYGESPDPVYDATFQAIADAFQERNPDIRLNVDFIGHPGGWEDRLIASIAGGTPPDVAYIDARIANEYRVRGLMTPLNAYLERLAPDAMQVENWIPNGPREYSYQGVWYGIPFRTDIRGLFINERLAEQAGVDPHQAPANIDELDQMAQKLSRQEGDGTISILGFNPNRNNLNSLYWSLAFGAEFYDWENNRLRFDDPGVLEALAWMVEYAERYGVANWGTEAKFQAESLAMHVNSTTTNSQLPHQRPDLRYWVHPLPYQPDGRNPTHSSVLGPMMPQGARHPEEAARFLAYLSEPETQLAWYRGTGSLPARAEALRAAVREMTDPRELNLVMQWPVTNARHPLFQQVRTDPRNGWRHWYERVMRGQASPQELVANMMLWNRELEAIFGQ